MKLFSRDDTTPRARAMWARSIDRLLAEVGRAPSPLRTVRRLYRRDVALASAPALLEIEEVLLDPTAAVRPEAMRRLRAFLTDGGRSRLYRDDPEAARRAAREIAAAFVVPAHAARS
jgi:hypothetical protein